MLIQHIALVSEADGIDLSELARVGAALQKQVTRDLSPAWGVHATVDTFPRLEDIPAGYWPILVTRGLAGDSGVRLDRDGTPYAQIEYSADWSVDASRACLELLVNPFGKRTVSAQSPRSDQGSVEVVVEVCAPCADILCAYAINDVVVSDFCLPAYYEEGPTAAGKRLSLNGSLSTPFRVAPGGHITWFDVVSESYWRRSHWTENPIDTRLGKPSHAAAPAREMMPDGLPARRRPGSPAYEAFHARIDLDRQHARRVSELRAMRMRASLLPSGLSRPPRALVEHVAEAERMAPRALSASEPHDAEAGLAADIAEGQATRPSAVPPPLPRSSKPPGASVRPSTPSTTQPQPTSSVAPVTILREPERAPRNVPVVIVLGALAAAAAVAITWRATQAPPATAAAPTTATAIEAAAAPAGPVTPIAAVAAAASAPLVTPAAVPATAAAATPATVPAATPAASVEPPTEQAAAAARVRTKRSGSRSLHAASGSAAATPALSAPPEPPAPAPAPVVPAVSAKPPAAQVESASIDDLIDTRR